MLALQSRVCSDTIAHMDSGRLESELCERLSVLSLPSAPKASGSAVSEFFAADSDWRSLRVQSSAGSDESLLLSMASVFSLLRPPSFLRFSAGSLFSLRSSVRRLAIAHTFSGTAVRPAARRA